MANDSETLTYRIRAIAEGLGAFRKTAEASEEVNNSMAKAIKLSDSLVGANKRLTAARDRQADALGKVHVAEVKVNEVRANSASKASQIASAEERLLTARRNAARAGSEMQRIEQEFRNVASKALVNESRQVGRDSGRNFSGGFTGFLKKDATSNFRTTSELVGRSLAGGIGNGLSASLRTQAGPLILSVMIAAVAIAAPAIGAVLAGGVVAGFGAGIATLGIVFAAKSEAVKAKWSAVMSQMGRDTQLLAKPFESVLIRIAGFAQRTFATFAPTLRTAFARAAVPVQTFADQAFRALEGLRPAITPITIAFNEMLKSLGPALQGAIKSVADGLIRVADSVRQNPTALADAIQGVGDLTGELLHIVAVLNDADGAFKRLTGGVSLVTITFQTLIAAVDILSGPFIILSKYIGFVSGTLNSLTHSSAASGSSMSDAANKTVALAQGLQKTGTAANSAGPALRSTHEIAVLNAAAAANAAQKFEAWINQLFRLQNLAITVAQSQLGLRQAVSAASAAIAENGRNINANTAKGQANRQALLEVARAAQTQTDAMIRGKASMASTAAAATAARADFIRLAVQMGFDSKAAQKMARDMISIPNVSRSVRLTAEKKDLDTKLANVRRQLADPNLTKERRARLTANKADLDAKLANVRRQLADPNLVKERRAKLVATKTDLDNKLAAARRALADPNLTRERRAKLNADIAALQAKLRTAQAQINAMHGKTIPITYTMNGVNYTLNTKTTSRVGGVATGGQIRGPGGDTADRAGLYALSNKEWVIRSKSAQQYGDYAMDAVNKGTATIIPGMARGGPVDIHATGVFKSGAQMQSVLGQMVGGPALAWAKSQVGKPYIWGGVGPAGYDCSGFMSAIVNVIRRQPPHRRLFATGSMPAGIFDRGPGRFEVGWFRGSPGHTAGTLNGVNVESSGGVGVRVGGGARGARDRMFNSGVYHLKGFAGGGKVGDPPYDGFDKWLASLVPSYKKGTPYVPETGLAYLHRGEKVTPAGGDSKVTFEFRSDGSPYMEWLVREFRKYIRASYEGDVQKALGGRRG